MNRVLRAFATGVALASTLILASPRIARAADPPSPAQIEKARKHFRAGTTLFNETDFAGALSEFQRAYETAPNWRVLFDLAQTYYQLQNYAAALDAFERYLAEGGDQVPAERRAAVEKDVAELGRRVAFATISVNVAGAEITVDDHVVGTSPLPGAVRVSSGRRKIRARKTGMLADERSLDVSGGDDLRVDLRLTQPQTVVQVRGEGSQPVLIGFAIATGVLAVGTGVFGALALTSSADWKRTREASVTADQQSSAIDKTKALAITTDVLGGLTALSAAATVYVYFKTRGSGQERTTQTQHVGLGPGSVHFSMSF